MQRNCSFVGDVKRRKNCGIGSYENEERSFENCISSRLAFLFIDRMIE